MGHHFVQLTVAEAPTYLAAAGLVEPGESLTLTELGGRGLVGRHPGRDAAPPPHPQAGAAEAEGPGRLALAPGSVVGRGGRHPRLWPVSAARRGPGRPPRRSCASLLRHDGRAGRRRQLEDRVAGRPGRSGAGRPRRRDPGRHAPRLGRRPGHRRSFRRPRVLPHIASRPLSLAGLPRPPRPATDHRAAGRRHAGSSAGAGARRLLAEEHARPRRRPAHSRLRGGPLGRPGLRPSLLPQPLPAQGRPLGAQRRALPGASPHLLGPPTPRRWRSSQPRRSCRARSYCTAG